MDDCRMKRSLHPRKGKVVMVRVEEVSVETNTASVSLVEYGSIRGTLTFTDADRVEVIAGRTEPALVSNVTGSFRQRTPPRRRISFRGFVIRRQASILLTLEGITEDERNNCEMSFTKALHVRSVLHHLARTRGSTLQEIYKLTRWPSYDDLMDRQSAYWGTLSNNGLRNGLLASCETVTYYSWRILDNTLLSSCRLSQKFGYCFAVALIRHYESYLKKNNMLPRAEFLSIQDFIDHLSEELVTFAGIERLDDAAESLSDEGVLLQRDGPPLTFVKADPTPRAGLHVYTPSTSDVELKVEVLPEDDYLKSQWNEFIKLRLLRGPMAASVIWFPSYCGRNIGPNEILSPTDEELAQFLANEEAFDVHCMLLTGHGMDEHGREYWEMQDSYGNVRNGDRGYLRVYLGQDPISIIEHVVIQRA